MNMVHLRVVPDDRRERTREKKRARMLAAASRIIDRDGLNGVTIKALAEELDCAVGTVYLYFPSKAALIAALEADAVARLNASYLRGRAHWDEALEREGLEPELIVLAQLCAFSAFLASASVVLADEFELLRHLLSDKIDFRERAEVQEALPVVEALLKHPIELLDNAVRLEITEPADNRTRALIWIAALNGVLPLDNLAVLDRHLFRAPHLARMLTMDLLHGWGADRADVEIAASHVEKLAARGPMAPPPDDPTWV
ncbi:MAG: TetR/AcrR family transcriptional regulator [Acidimicrobiales bacterium]|nr:TetR/AcrR family transcriptional regulator [Acidimicrobiales bacterium]